ncbi:hypothetical protein FisN_21Hh057 [Fistulifera solaris]|uniref:RRM domain-containing protein n=1 Tax=Fistulifera solaris TaxID=1519565 RepID=A0A1Z5KBF8_FISSO|nr:hypothetical protein FisN_21Hh057 [Fistulifera solaris]|eukprot:GAX23258.1 hypothetical protein FisN_21Hh057 [Fistulifera solaris]
MKEKKKDKKRKRSEVEGSDDNASIDDDKEKRRARREERKQWLEKVPKVDEHGIAYTKLQLRRMAKRMARGLDPIESEAEKQERLKSEAELRREEQDELEGIIRKPIPREKEDSGHEAEESDNEREESRDAQRNVNMAKHESIEPQTVYKNKRKKEVPEDYVCSACQNKHTPVHWIYDCPSKKTIRGTNQLSKKLRGLHNPSATKVFVSGLPFSMTSKELKDLFEKASGPVARAKAITFPDSGRCKGQGIVTFQDEEGARKALTAMNGKQLDVAGDSKKGGKQLQLKVTKVLNRKVSKQRSASN